MDMGEEVFLWWWNTIVETGVSVRSLEVMKFPWTGMCWRKLFGGCTVESWGGGSFVVCCGVIAVCVFYASNLEGKMNR